MDPEKLSREIDDYSSFWFHPPVMVDFGSRTVNRFQRALPINGLILAPAILGRSLPGDTFRLLFHSSFGVPIDLIAGAK
jgi:hypothetical protein